MHEVLTIQFGHFSNFVGTHFWNTQEAYFTYDDQNPEMLHDILFRTGVTPKGVESYTPRALIYDLKGGFGSLKKTSKLYEAEEPAAKTWDQDVQTFEQPAYPRNKFLRHLEEEEKKGEDDYGELMDLDAPEPEFDLDNDITLWSDFNRVYYHPRTACQVNQFQLGDEFAPFEVYPQGMEAYAQFEKEQDAFEQNFRFFTEECDYIQGFQILTHAYDGFGGFSTAFLEELREEFPKTAVLTYGLMDPRPARGGRNLEKQNLNIALSTVSLTNLSSTFVPIYSPTASTLQTDGWSKYLSLKTHLPYHTSAVLSAGIECTSLAWRVRENSIPMGDLLGRLNWRGNTKIASLSLAFPLPLQGDEYGDAAQFPLEGRRSIVKDLSVRGEHEKETVFAQSVVFRGAPDVADPGRKSRATFVSEVLDRFETVNKPARSSFFLQTPYPLPNSFPRFFHSLSADGYLGASNRPVAPPHSVPMLSNLCTTSRTQHFLRPQTEAVRPAVIRTLVEFTEGPKGVGVDDLENAREGLMDLVEVYESR